jgi:PAS domain S-box-containing protein
LRRRVLTVVAALLVAVTVATIAVDVDGRSVVTGLLPLTVSLGLFALDLRRERSRESTGDTSVLIRWVLVGTTGFALLGAWVGSLAQLGFAPPPRFYPITALSIAGLVGGLIGVYKVRELQRRTERETAETNFSELFDRIDDALLLYDPETTEVVRANDAAEDLWGYGSDEILGKTASDLSADVPQLNDRIASYVSELREGEPQQFDWLLRRADGSHLWANVNASLTTVDGEQHIMALIRDISDRKQREEAIQELHDATREMVRATEKDEVGRIVVDAAETILELPLVGVWCLDETETFLEPAAMSTQASELFETHPTFRPDEGIAWDVFQRQDPVVYDDVSTVDGIYNEDTVIRSEMLIPCGTNGLLIAGSTEAGVFSETDVSLARLLAANAQVALDRVMYIDQLTRRTHQMEFFNGLIRHDVMNAMTVIGARADLLQSELDGEQRRHAETIRKWTDDAVDVVRHVRDILQTITDVDGPELEPTDVTATVRSEVDRIRATYPEVTFELDLEPDLAVKANDLLGDVLGNVVGNAVEHNETDGLRVVVTVESDADDGVARVRVADNGSGIPDERKDAVFRRGETGHVKHTGSGFGLFFVDVMVSAYDGTVRIEDRTPTEDREASGAVFVVELPLAGVRDPVPATSQQRVRE